MENYIPNKSHSANNRGKWWTYHEVGKLQLHLTEEEEIALLSEYQQLRKTLHTYILSKKVCREWFIEKYKTTIDSGKSVSKLSAMFNPQIQGESSALTTSMNTSMSTGNTADILYSMKISDDCYSEMSKLIHPPTETLVLLQDKIKGIEETLLRTMLKAAHEIAIRNSSTMLSIDAMDAAQEVNMYLLESIRKYDPEYRTPEGNRVKLVTYAYGRADRLLQEWILTTSRLVRVPRSKMERILIIVKAYENLMSDDINIEALTEESNNILEGRKGEDTLVSRFTMDEVDGLIKVLTSNYIHLDQPWNRTLKSRPETIGDMIANDDLLADETVEVKRNKERLLSIMKDTLTETELQILTLRYFHDTTDKVPRALTDVSELLKSEYNGKEYSRESIRQIEKSAISKLKEVEEVQNLW